MNRIVLARHGESEYSARGLLNGDPTVPIALTPRGREQARLLAERLRDEQLDLCVVTEFPRVQETADVVLFGREIPRLVLPDLNDPRYGDYEGAQLADYRAWAAGASSSTAPGEDGESRLAIVKRYVRGYRALLDRPEDAVLFVGHSLPISYAVGAREGIRPGAHVPLAELATPYRFTRDELEQAVDLLAGWVAAPTW